MRITLEGKTSNRDAIGAVVEITTKDGSPLVKSLRAGEFFMSQGSKALHFGLGQHRDIARVRVLWPGGAWQSFPRLSAHKHYHLQQGVSRPIEIPLPSAPTVATKTANAEPRARQSPIHLPVKIPIFPSFHYRDQALKLQALPPSKANRVILLWSSQCAACFSNAALRGCPPSLPACLPACLRSCLPVCPPARLCVCRALLCV